MAKKIVQNLKKGKSHKGNDLDSLKSTLQIESDLHVEYAKILVSLWSYACNVDGQLQKAEGELVAELIHVLFEPDCLLSGFQTQKKQVLDILSKTFENPLPMKTIAKSVANNDEYALNFFEDAVCIVASDGTLKPGETKFLDDLSKEFGIAQMDKERVLSKYLN